MLVDSTWLCEVLGTCVRSTISRTRVYEGLASCFYDTGRNARTRTDFESLLWTKSSSEIDDTRIDINIRDGLFIILPISVTDWIWWLSVCITCRLILSCSLVNTVQPSNSIYLTHMIGRPSCLHIGWRRSTFWAIDLQYSNLYSSSTTGSWPAKRGHFPWASKLARQFYMHA